MTAATTVDWPTERSRPPDRLFGDVPATTLADHLRRHGAAPHPGLELIDEVARAGLHGRGGAGFPTHRKLAAVAERRRPIVVANGCEGEPASGKDRSLLTFVPHLVLDGAMAAATAVGATKVVVCIERGQPGVADAVRRACRERLAAAMDPRPIELRELPRRYVAGEETALVHWLNGGDARPQLVPPRPFERGVDRRPTLIDNVETLAQLALIARHGAAWYRSVGTADDPGSYLLTITGTTKRPGVYEVEGGAPLPQVLADAGVDLARTDAVLVGGYFGTWFPATAAASLRVSAASLASAGASLGCGAVFALPTGACGLAEATRVARWLADQNAGQCGPCVHGLDAIAATMEALVAGGRSAAGLDAIATLAGLVEGRGACKHPDGVVRFVRSAVQTFGPHLADHGRRGPCAAGPRLLPTPAPGGWR
jgi:NADH:ubiquinone oxidoreductase subunit F (NADH-binding)